MARAMSSALAFILCSCASLSLQYGEPSRYDTRCGKSGSVEVRLRPGVFTDCPEALGFVGVGLSFVPLASPWSIIIGNEPAGFDIKPSAFDIIRYTQGATYPQTGVIALQGLDERALLHELGHAWDFEHGLANRRDR